MVFLRNFLKVCMLNNKKIIYFAEILHPVGLFVPFWLKARLLMVAKLRFQLSVNYSKVRKCPRIVFDLCLRVAI